MTTIPDPPAGFGVRGSGFWTKITTDYSMSPDEIEILTECCRTLDLVDRLDGDPDETRTLLSARALLGRLLAQLKIPDGLSSPAKVRAQTAAATRWANAPNGSEVSRLARWP